MENFISVIKVVTSLAVFIPTILAIFKLLSANDLDFAFFSKLNQNLGNFLVKAELFLANIVMIWAIIFLLYDRLPISNVLKMIADTVITVVSVVIIVALCFSKINWEKEYMKKIMNWFVEKNDLVITIFLITAYICCSIIVHYIILPTNLLVQNALYIIIMPVICSVYINALINMIKTIRFSNGKEAKFYFIEDENKCYIYYSQNDGYIVYGKERSFKQSGEYGFIQVDKLRNEYKVFREDNN